LENFFVFLKIWTNFKKFCQLKTKKQKQVVGAHTDKKLNYFSRFFLKLDQNTVALENSWRTLFFPPTFERTLKKSFLAQRLRNVERNLLEPHTQKKFILFFKDFCCVFFIKQITDKQNKKVIGLISPSGTGGKHILGLNFFQEKE